MRKYVRIMSVILLFSVLLTLIASCKGDQTDYSAGDEIFNAVFSRDGLDSDGEAVRYEDDGAAEVYSEARGVFLSYLSGLGKNGNMLSNINGDVDVVLDCDREVLTLLERAIALNKQTDGLFQPCGGALTALFRDTEIPSDEAVNEAMLHVGVDKFEITDSAVKKSDRLAAFDLGTVAEGYAMQKAVQSFESKAIAYGVLSSENTVALLGEKPNGEKFNVAVPGDDGYIGWFTVPRGYISYVDADTDVWGLGTETNEFLRVAVYAADGITAAAVANAIWLGGTDGEKSISKELGGAYCMAAVTADGRIVTSTDAVSSGLFVIRETDGE